MGWVVVSGYLCLIAGLVLGAIAILVPDLRASLGVTAVVLVPMGLFDILLGRYLAGLLKGFPKMKGFRAMMRDSAETMSSAALMLNQETRSDQLRASGLDAQAEVLAMRDTGQLFNFDPILEFDLRIHQGWKTPYKVENYRQLVSKIMISKISVGATYPAKVDPQDLNRLILSWT
jgi:hypothetical protein